MAKRKYNWSALRDLYVMGDDEVTLEWMASQKDSPAVGTLKDKSSKGDWPEQRRQYRDQVTTKARGRASTSEAELRVRHIKIAKALQAKALKRLQVLDINELSPSELRLYLKDATEIERKAAGIPDLTVMNEHEIDDAIRTELARLAAVGEA